MEAVVREGVRLREWASHIAKKLGKTKNAVLGRATRLGLKWNLSRYEKAERGRINALKNPKRFAWAAGRKGQGGVHTGFDT